MTLLAPYRVLDLTDHRGNLAGLILAQLGAEVVAVEPPGGSAARRQGPFVADIAGVERSLVHWAYNRGKRSVVLDLDGSGEDRAALWDLVEGADILLENGAPGALSALGLGPEEMAARNPALVYVSITPFGQSGPKSAYATSDLVMMAAGGYLALTGDEDRAPGPSQPAPGVVPRRGRRRGDRTHCAVRTATHRCRPPASKPSC